jgi:hypothetical protein
MNALNWDEPINSPPQSPSLFKERGKSRVLGTGGSSLKTRARQTKINNYAMKKITIFGTVILLLFFFSSCKKNTSYDLGPNVNASNDVILSLSSFTAVFNLLIKARLDTALSLHGHTVIEGVFVTFNATNNQYDLDFGSCISPDSVSRTGRIVVQASGDILQKGSFAKVFFQSYYEDYGKVNGADSIRNEGVNAFNQMVFSNTVSNMTIDKVVGRGTITVNANTSYKTLTSSLVNRQDILFLVKGNISGLSSKGHPFYATLRDTLLDSFSCPWIKGGIVDLHVSDADIPDGTIDFVSDDGCSDYIWYYIDDSSFKVKKNQFGLRN